MTQKSDGKEIKDLLKEELAAELAFSGAERFRAGQVLDWVYKRNIIDFDAMTNLPPGLRRAMKEKFYIGEMAPVRLLDSADGTKKILFGLEDGQHVETVYIPSRGTSTVCVSSQVGCRRACGFCASGKKGFVRDLKPSEMVNQVLFLKNKGMGVTNVVFMGMGEPLDNYDNVLKAIRILNAPYGLGIGQRKITVSTCGVIPGIKRFASEKMQVELSVSLHSPFNNVRSGLMPVNKKYPPPEMMDSCREYARTTNRQVTFEYVMIKGLNDSLGDARETAVLLKGMLAKVNLILFNPVEGLGYFPPSPSSVKVFKDALDKKGVVSTVRRSRGADIDAACGQLRIRHEK